MEKEPQNLKDIFEAGILTGQFMRNYTNRNIKAKRFKIMDHPWTFLRKWSSYWSFIHKEFSYVRWTWEGFFALVNVQMNNVIFSAAYNFLIYIWVASEFDVHSSYSSRWAGPLIHGHKFFSDGNWTVIRWQHLARSIDDLLFRKVEESDTLFSLLLIRIIFQLEKRLLLTLRRHSVSQ